MPGIRRSRAPWGDSIHATADTIHLVENVAECAMRLEVARPDSLAFVTQTTLSVDDTQAIVDALRARFPALQAPRIEDICYATQNRQDAVKRLLRALRRAGGGGFGHQFQFQPPARAGRARRHSRLPGRRARQPAARVVRRPQARSASRPARRRRKCWCSRWWSGCANGAASAPREILGREENVVFSLPRPLRSPRTGVPLPAAGPKQS